MVKDNFFGPAIAIVVKFSDPMNSANLQILPAPPSLVKSLTAGFDAISNHAGLILLPIMLDLLIWVGPRLRVDYLMEPLLVQMQQMPEAQDPQMLQGFREIAQGLNLLSVLRTLPVGLPSLVAGRQLSAWAGGPALTWQTPNFLTALLVWAVLMLFGLACGALYFSLVGQAALLDRVNLRLVFSRWFWSFGQVLLLAVTWIILGLAVLMPFSCFFSLLAMGGLGGGQLSALGMLLGGALFIWLILPFAFSPHGIFVYGLDFRLSILRSLRVTRATFWSTSLFWLSALVLSEGLDILWNVPVDTSWFLLVGIAGHAFVTTALLAASFIYYRDANRWVQGLLERSQSA